LGVDAFVDGSGAYGSLRREAVMGGS
jgi:hypothetical protein